MQILPSPPSSKTATSNAIPRMRTTVAKFNLILNTEGGQEITTAACCGSRLPCDVTPHSLKLALIAEAVIHWASRSNCVCRGTLIRFSVEGCMQRSGISWPRPKA
eukprot:s126_g30.t1